MEILKQRIINTLVYIWPSKKLSFSKLLYSIVLVLLSISLNLKLAHADLTVPISKTGEWYAQDRKLVNKFRGALGLIGKNKLPQATEQLDSLRESLSVAGYRNAPDFSFKLIRTAKNIDLNKDTREFLYSHSENLSPTHPGVLLALSSVSSVYSLGASANFLLRAIAEMPHYPLTLISTIARTFIGFAVALLITLLIIVLVHLVSGSSELYVKFSVFFPKRNRGLLTCMTYLACMFIPLTMPLLLALVFWVTVLSFALARVMWLSLATGLMLVILFMCMPLAYRIVGVSESHISLALETSSQGGYTTRAQDHVDDMLKKDEANPVLLVLLGQILQERNQVTEAERLYRQTEGTKIDSKSIPYLIDLNTGVLEYNKGEIESAHLRWTKLYEDGWREFSLLYNLTLSSTYVFKDDQYRLYYSILQKSFSKDIKYVSSLQGDTPVPILGRLPKEFFFSLIKSSLGTFEHFTESSYAQFPNTLTSSIAGSVSREAYQFLTLLLFFLSYWQSKSSKVSYRYRGSLITKNIFLSIRNNQVWRYLPFAWCVVEKKEFILILSMSLMILFGLLASGAPVALTREQSDGYILSLIPLFLLVIINIRPSRVTSLGVRK